MAVFLVTHLPISINIYLKCKANLLLHLACKIDKNANPIHIKINIEVTWKVDTCREKLSQEKKIKYERLSQSNVFNNVEIKSKHNEKAVSVFLNVNG